LISRVALRVATKPLGHTTTLVAFLKLASHVLKSFEPLLTWPDEAEARTLSDVATIPAPPHRARGLFDTTNSKDDTMNDTRHTLHAWAETVTMLWRVAMLIEGPKLPVDVGIWHILTCRLLLLQALPWSCPQSAYEVDLKEWARRETLRCLLQAEAEEEKRMEIDNLIDS
jgi:hypothetical protein